MEEEKKKEMFIVRIGPLLMKKLEEQKQRIKVVTYDCVGASHYEAGEIIAKKIKV